MGCSNAIELPQKWWEKTSMYIVNSVEHVFFVLGVKVAKSPWKTIAISWAFVLLSAIGFFNFHHEKNPLKLWVPPESDFVKDTEWLMSNFRLGFRQQVVVITADNVLDAKVLLLIHDLSEKVEAISVNVHNQTVSFNEVCFRVPVINTLMMDSSMLNNYNEVDGKSEKVYFDPSVQTMTYLYCEFVNNMKQTCFKRNILDVWNYDQGIISNLTSENLLNNVNSVSVSPSTGHPFNFTTLLSGIERNEQGAIISAKAVKLTWFIKLEYASIDLDKNGNIFGTEEWTTEEDLAWESEFLKVLENYSESLNNDIKLFYQAERSYGDISGATMFQEIDKLFIGITLMFFYVQYVLAGNSWLEIRLTLGGVGLLCVGMAYITACSWCAIIGIPFGPVHASLPFLLMGLGVDDMFVMKACWEQLTPEERKKSHPQQIGYMLKHAGVSIVITSFTDVVAFLVGSITILPSLRSFCYYAAVGVFFIFYFSVTFYVAVFSLDEKRIRANRNGVLFCYKHKTPPPEKVSKPLSEKILSAFYKNVIFTLPIKIFIIIFTICITGFSISRLYYLEQRFDPMWFIPEGTYFKEYLKTNDVYFPEDSKDGYVLFGKMNYSAEGYHLYNLSRTISKFYYVKDLQSWVVPFKNYVQQNFRKNYTEGDLSTEDFDRYLSKFLFSPSGGRFRNYFTFEGDLICGVPAPKILANMMPFKFKRFLGPEQYIPAMHEIKDLVQNVNIQSGDGYRGVWSKLFANWVTDELIAVEVERNVELALICVMACTIFLITNLQMCLWIFICVLLTLINVCGWMQMWGLTIDIVSCIGLELAVGLCVDYAAHVGHTFLTLREGTRADRALVTVTSIGTAVLYGGGATMLSLSVLSMSKAYTFNCFFKIFVLVILFGLFNGLIFLPVVLSFVGPLGYHHVDKNKSHEVEAEIEVLDKSLKGEIVNDTKA